MIKEFSNFEKFLLLIVFIGGSLILFVPINNLFVALVGIIGFLYLLMNPKICYYILIITSSIVIPFGTPTEQMPFSHIDILITICFLGVLLKIMFIDRKKINLRTKIDFWLIALLIIYCYCGLTSASHRGYQGFLRYGEVFSLFYITIYLIKTKMVSVSKIIKIMIFTGLAQAVMSIFQSVTSIGSTFESNRGYLGYLGIGSSHVWHGMGTLNHFNCCGAFLSSLILFFIPIYHFIIKNKKAGKIILAILMMGIITTYSRNALICTTIGLLFFFYNESRNKIKFSVVLGSIGIVALSAYNFLKNTSYLSTLSPRDAVWDYCWDVITASPHNFLLGTGLKSFDEVITVYMANTYVFLHAHNLYLSLFLETGLIGLILILTFLVINVINAKRGITAHNKFQRVLNFSIYLYLIAILALGIFDNTFEYFYTQTWLYFVLGLLYAKNKNLQVIRNV